jgi:hypothetical protein
MDFKYRWRAFIILALSLTAILVIFSFDPRSASIYPPCPYRTLTGYYCPGCGAGQAAYFFLHGQLELAFYYNPLAVITFPVIALALIFQFAAELRGRRAIFWSGHRWVTFFVGLLPLIFILFWIIRNTPWYPFYPH